MLQADQLHLLPEDHAMINPRNAAPLKYALSMKSNVKPRAFSGIQPTGNIHIGNYIGAIRQWVASQEAYDAIYCIVDLHAITVPQDPATLRQRTREVAALLFAAGIDPKRSAVFVQSQIPAHAELAWILNCYIPMGWMQRMTQFKEKSEKQKEDVSTGLFDYPALMAADILLYDTDVVPVGADQKQHVELARDAARRFNSIYGETFRLTEPVFVEAGKRIMALDDPTRKMSKSEAGEAQAIGLLDSPDEIRTKIARATTDSGKEVRFDESRPGIYNLLTIYEIFSGMKPSEIEARFAAKGYAELKGELTDVLIGALRPLQDRYHELTGDPAYIAEELARGRERVLPLATRTLERVKAKIGLG